jgi:hypothetical protein
MFAREPRGENHVNLYLNHVNFFLKRCVIKYYVISHGHIGDGYREIQETGTHRSVFRTLTGVIGSGKNICSRS